MPDYPTVLDRVMRVFAINGCSIVLARTIDHEWQERFAELLCPDGSINGGREAFLEVWNDYQGSNKAVVDTDYDS